MLSLGIHAEYEGSALAEIIHNPLKWVMQTLSAMIATIITCMNRQRKHFIAQAFTIKESI